MTASQTKQGVLYVVATPIGNLSDMTFRAVKILQNVHAIACEDTRVTSKLLSHYDIRKPLLQLHHHSSYAQYETIRELLRSGKDVAVVTDAGTPGVCDPGNALVSHVTSEGFLVVPIPGASALTAILSIAGCDTQKFIFLGFPPHKKGRKTFFDQWAAIVDMPTVFFESSHRVSKALDALKERDPRRHLVVGRELTKMFEETIRGTSSEVAQYFVDNPQKIKGEFVLLSLPSYNTKT